MKIDVNTIKILAENIEKFNLNEVALESEGVKLVMKKEKPVRTVEVVRAEPIVEEIIEQTPVVQVAEQVAQDEEFDYIVAPMVGTFYIASAPGNPPFVEIGQEVKDGTTVCIIEAMKLMNEVKTNKAGKIVKVIAENGKIVKKGDKLFAIK